MHGVMWASYAFYERKPRCTEQGARRPSSHEPCILRTEATVHGARHPSSREPCILVNRVFSIDILDTSLRLQSASFIHSPMTFKRLEASSVTNQRRLTSGGAGSTEASHHESWVAECTGGEPAASSSSRSDHP